MAALPLPIMLVATVAATNVDPTLRGAYVGRMVLSSAVVLVMRGSDTEAFRRKLIVLLVVAPSVLGVVMLWP